MHLLLLQETASVSISYDCTNHWLFVDWRGDLTLPVVQAGCLVLAKCFVARAYPRILNSNSRVTGMAPDVAAWLAQEYLPGLPLSGIEYIAWVYAPNLRSKRLTDEAVRNLEAPVVNTFDDLASAYSWLRTTHFNHVERPAPSASTRQKFLAYRINTLSAAVLAHQNTTRRLLRQVRCA